MDWINTKNKTKLVFEDNFLYKLAQIQLVIHAEEIIDANKVTDVIGTGPFIFNNYQAGDVPQLLLSRNDDYYEADENGDQLQLMLLQIALLKVLSAIRMPKSWFAFVVYSFTPKLQTIIRFLNTTMLLPKML